MPAWKPPAGDERRPPSYGRGSSVVSGTATGIGWAGPHEGCGSLGRRRGDSFQHDSSEGDRTVHEWQVWLVVALLLFVAEILAPGFWLLSVAVGCVVAGLVSLVVPGFLAPALSFAAGTLL